MVDFCREKRGTFSNVLGSSHSSPPSDVTFPKSLFPKPGHVCLTPCQRPALFPPSFSYSSHQNVDSEQTLPGNLLSFSQEHQGTVEGTGGCLHSHAKSPRLRGERHFPFNPPDLSSIWTPLNPPPNFLFFFFLLFSGCSPLQSQREDPFLKPSSSPIM